MRIEAMLKNTDASLEVAPVDRAVHASGLFGSHVGECPGNGLRRVEVCRSQGSREAIPATPGSDPFGALCEMWIASAAYYLLLFHEHCDAPNKMAEAIYSCEI